MVVRVCNFEARACESDDAEDGEVDPAELFLEAMAEDDDEGEDEDGNVDANLSNSNCFLSGHHIKMRE